MDRFTEPDPLIGPADPVTKMNHRLRANGDAHAFMRFFSG
jgi:hypothetical protein